MSNVKNTVIGIDYGTQSARALLVDAATGQVLESKSIRYPRGILPGDLVEIDDYLETLDELLKAVSVPAYRDTIRGICVDATSLTLVCIAADGTPLSKLPGFADREQAKIKLWKRHEASAQASEALALAKARKEPFLGRTGGTISEEWTLPKILEIRDRDPEVYAKADAAFDLCEYLTYCLTGEIIRSVGSMCYKGTWAQDLGFPSDDYLDALRPGFAAEYKHLLRGKVCIPGECVGTISKKISETYGLPANVVVATGVLDGHTAQVALGALGAGDGALVVGTSNVLTIQTNVLQDIEGICGIAKDGQTPYLCGLDTGQACTGDMLEWYITNAVPASVKLEADEKGVGVHELLASRIKTPWESKLTVADWWNGSRNTPCDLHLSGVVHGLTMDTKPEDLYLALLQAIVCGTREIVEQCASYGVAVDRVLATGGITGKNPLLMQEYANILNKPVCVGQFSEGPALGAAIFAAVAAGVYPTVQDAYANMGIANYTTYTPDAEHRAAYEAIYTRNHKLRRLIAAMEQEDRI